MNTAKASHESPSRQSQSELLNRYRRIGISAVVAALPYKSDSKNLAYAPAEPAEE